jgi:hypothetical protein
MNFTLNPQMQKLAYAALRIVLVFIVCAKAMDEDL